MYAQLRAVRQKCHILKGRDAETLYAEYIEGKMSYMEITLEIRK